MSIIQEQLLFWSSLDEVNDIIEFFDRISNEDMSFIENLDEKSNKQCIKNGIVIKQDLLLYLMNKRGNANNLICNVVIKKLSDNFFIQNIINTNCFKISTELFKFFMKGDRIKNILYGKKFIYDRYMDSICKIDVDIHNKKSEENDKKLSSGTGFILNDAYYHQQIIVTNKHIAENNIQSITNCSGYSFEIENILFSDKCDLAFIIIKKCDIEGLMFSYDLSIGTEICTIGFPYIPTFKYKNPVLHSGEINCLGQCYLDSNNDYFIFSAKTEPGNSGSPILDLTGSIIGIVSSDFVEFKKSDSNPIITRYYAGISYETIRRELNTCL